MGSSKLLASVFFWCSFWCDDLPQLQIQRSVTPSGALTPSEGCCFSTPFSCWVLHESPLLSPFSYRFIFVIDAQLIILSI